MYKIFIYKRVGIYCYAVTGYLNANANHVVSMNEYDIYCIDKSEFGNIISLMETLGYE